MARLRRDDFWLQHTRSSDDGVPDTDGTPRNCAAEGSQKASRPAGGPEMPRLLCCRISQTHYPESARSSAANTGYFSPIAIPAITRTVSKGYFRIKRVGSCLTLRRVRAAVKGPRGALGIALLNQGGWAVGLAVRSRISCSDNTLNSSVVGVALSLEASEPAAFERVLRLILSFPVLPRSVS